MSDREKKLWSCFTDLQRAAVACATHSRQTEKIFVAHAQKILRELHFDFPLAEIKHFIQVANPAHRADKFLTLGLRLKGGLF